MSMRAPSFGKSPPQGWQNGRYRVIYSVARKGKTLSNRSLQSGSDQVAVGHRASLRFSSFNQRTTPEINGVVTKISADISQDQRAGNAYYIVRIAMSADEVARLNGLKLVAGMPVEAFIKTEDRTVMSYLVKPLHEQLLKAFRER
jgi:HlyD family secretion protein